MWGNGLGRDEDMRGSDLTSGFAVLKRRERALVWMTRGWLHSEAFCVHGTTFDATCGMLVAFHLPFASRHECSYFALVLATAFPGPSSLVDREAIPVEG